MKGRRNPERRGSPGYQSSNAREVTEDLNDHRSLSNNFKHFFYQAFSKFRIFSEVQPISLERRDVDELVLSAANSIIEIKTNSCNNFFILCVDSRKKEIGDMKLYFITRDVNGKWTPLSIALEFNIFRVVRSGDINDVMIEQIISANNFSEIRHATKWCKSVFWMALSYFASIGRMRTEEPYTHSKLFELHNASNNLPTQDIGDNKGRTGKIKKLISLDETEGLSPEDLRQLTAMKKIEDDLILSGAKPGKDYTRLDIIGLAKDYPV